MQLKDTPLGSSNFGQIIRENRYYVDKTMLVRHILKGQTVTLLCRPRRFGKTLNMQMLRHFFAKGENNAHLFEGLAISRDAESMQHQGKYPVIYLSLKDIKFSDAVAAFWQMRALLKSVWRGFSHLSEHEKTRQDYEMWMSILENPQSLPHTYAHSVKELCGLLGEYHGTQVIILIDEYDTPVHAAWQHGYYDEMVSFLRLMLGAAMKDNVHLKKGVLTGILRVSKESMFSDLNNFIASTVLDNDLFSDQFGFTEAEVLEMLQYYGMNGREMEQLREWYDGYRFGKHTIYNPWSILNYVFSLDHDLTSYWVNTSQDSLLRKLMFNDQSGIKNQIQQLLEGQKLAVVLDQHLTFSKIDYEQQTVWTLLVMAGYLKTENKREENLYDISIPNKEIRRAFKDGIQDWVQTDMRASTRPRVLEALTEGRVKDFEYELIEFVIRVFSYHDTERRYAENFYHAFFLGLLAGLEHRYRLTSNREAGYGRYDICLTPKNPVDRGIVIEIKAPEADTDETIQDALASAVQQLEQKKYDKALEAAGVSSILRIAIAVQGKAVKVKSV
jgi:Predicted AAA-ATPase/PD-(D/E)XK nuclease superfamily